MSYKITLNTSGLEYKSQGETVLEALQNLNILWVKIKAKGVLTVTKGKLSYSHLFTLPILRKIFLSKGFMMVWAKRLELLLK